MTEHLGQMRRRLATILIADIVGSTPAMEANEEAAVLHFEDCLSAVSAVVERRDGRVFSTRGDSLLAEFSSPVNALRAAMEARSALVSVEGASAKDMRFGLHLADILEIGGDLRGDGINLAARIQSHAQPGEIYVSSMLVEQVRRGSPCAFEDLGAIAFKGISEPVQVFRVIGEMDRFPFQTAPTRVSERTELRPHSVAVVPFRTAASADEDQKFIADGLTEDLIHELSRRRHLFVSSRSASFALEGVVPGEIGRRLGVRYVISGSVRKLGTGLRLNLSLSETESGRTLWSDRLELDFDKIWEALDEVTARIAATVFGRIEKEDISTARKRNAHSLDAYEKYLRGIEHHRLGQLTDKHIRDAMDWFGRAIESDPDFAAPVAMQVCAASQLIDFDWDWGLRQVTKALEIDPHHPEIHRIMGSIKMKLGDFEASRHYHERALELAPNDAYIAARCAAFHVYAGEPERALELLRRAEELDPFLPVWCVEEKVAAYYSMGRCEEALEAARSLPFQTRRTRLYRAACRMAMGDEAAARQHVAEALAENPGLALDFVEANENFADPQTMQTLLDRLRRAGLPEPPEAVKANLPRRLRTVG